MAQLLLANPRKRRAKRKVAAKKVAAPRRRRSVSVSTTTKVTRRRYKRNPSSRVNIVNQVQSAAIGAAGALAVDIAMSKLTMIPVNLRTGVAGSAMQGAVSIAIGMLVGKFANKRIGAQIADGGLTVALHGALKSAVGPSVGLNGWDNGLLGYDSGLLGYQSLNGYQDLNSGVGFLNTAPVQSFDSAEWYQ